MLSMRSICQAERFLSLSWEPLSFCSPPSVARTRQEIQLSSLLTTALLVPLSADRSATELSIIRLASELIAILASELLHLSLREQAISVHHVWLEIFPVPSFIYNSTITFTFLGWSSYPTLRIIRLALASPPSLSLLCASQQLKFSQHTGGAFIFISVINIECNCS